MNKKRLHSDFNQMGSFDEKENFLSKNNNGSAVYDQILRLSYKEFNIVSFDEAIDKIIHSQCLAIRDPCAIERHSQISTQMRSVLIEWISEVTSVFRFASDTFDLSVMYLDHFIGSAKNIEKINFQLIGITCLFIAAKLNEVNVPKVEVFASFTDGACSKDQIIQFEISIIKSLNWRLSTVTLTNVIFTLLASHCLNHNKRQRVSKYLTNKISLKQFKDVYQLVNFCILDINSLNFSILTLCVSAIQLIYQVELNINYSLPNIYQCLNWMNPFFVILRQYNLFDNNNDECLLTSNFFQYVKELDFMKLMPLVQTYNESNQLKFTNQISSFVLTPP